MVRLQPLPPPDWLEFPAPAVCLVTNDGTQTTVQLAQALLEQGSTVVVLSFPTDIVPARLSLPAAIVQIELTDLSESQLQHQIGTLMTTYGAIDTFIHLHPRSPLTATGLSFPDADQAILRQVFLLAKYLKQSLVTTAQRSRSCFMSAAWLDGAFGLAQNQDFNPIAAGLFGLTKALRHEWPAVFCRALDFSPALSPEELVQHLLAELHDPNLAIAEVGYRPEGRTTLTC